jgi:hypothetical protein
LATAQERTETRLAELATAQERTETRLAELATAQERTETRLAELVVGQRTLTAAQERTETQLSALLSWQKGEDGRRRGEHLERDVARSAFILFAGGEGGTADQRWVQQWLTQLLAPILQQDPFVLPPEDDPGRADLLWRKGDTIAVVEVSWIVDDYDVQRAFRRAETVRRAGVTVVPVVIGDSWANGEVRFLAETYRMAWKVGNDVSDAYIALRRLPV